MIFLLLVLATDSTDGALCIATVNFYQFCFLSLLKFVVVLVVVWWDLLLQLGLSCVLHSCCCCLCSSCSRCCLCVTRLSQCDIEFTSVVLYLWRVCLMTVWLPRDDPWEGRCIAHPHWVTHSNSELATCLLVFLSSILYRNANDTLVTNQRQKPAPVSDASDMQFGLSF